MRKSLGLGLLLLALIGVILASAWTSTPKGVAAIGLRDDAATIAAADAAKYEVLRRQQEAARIAQLTRVAIAEATRQEQSRIAEATRQEGDRIAEATRQEQTRTIKQTQTARDAQATQSAGYVRATATAQVLQATDQALKSTQIALEAQNAQATRMASDLRATEAARAQEAESQRQAAQTLARMAQLRLVGVVLLFTFSTGLFMVTARAMWRIKHPVFIIEDAPKPKETEEEVDLKFVDNAAEAEQIMRLWENAEPK